MSLKKKIIWITASSFLAALVFCSISFIQVASFWINLSSGAEKLRVGLPFTYYEQFLMDGHFHHGGYGINLLLDIGITWLLVFTCRFFWQKASTNDHKHLTTIDSPDF